MGYEEIYYLLREIMFNFAFVRAYAKVAGEKAYSEAYQKEFEEKANMIEESLKKIENICIDNLYWK